MRARLVGFVADDLYVTLVLQAKVGFATLRQDYMLAACKRIMRLA